MRSELGLRITTGVIAAAAFLGLIWWNELGFRIVCWVVGLACMYELMGLLRVRAFHPAAIAVYCLYTASLAVKGIPDGDLLLVFIVAFLVPILPLLVLGIWVLKPPKEEAPRAPLQGPWAVGAAFFALVYTATPFLLLYDLAVGNLLQGGSGGYQPWVAFGLFGLVWMSDIGGYAIGKPFGKHKIIPAVSPGKSWEGLIGVLLFPQLLAIVLALLWPMAVASWFVTAVLISVFGFWGDLAESKLKRVAGVKDSGRLLPGHGGLLDRFDAFLFALPPVWLYWQHIAPALAG